jgi:CPA2 family monovalent cation:H+ antiporter-2
MTDFLLLAFVFLIAGVIAVPIATRFGLGSVLGYLIAGIVISPILALFHVDVIAIQHFAEFGVVMMLFLVGLELQPKQLWDMRGRLLGLGGGQVALTAAGGHGGVHPLRPIVERRARRRSRPCAVLHRDRPADAEREGPDALGWRAGVVLRAPRPGHRGDPDAGAPAACWRCRNWPTSPMARAPTPPMDARGRPRPGLSLVAGLTGWQTALVNLGAIALVIGVGSRLTEPLFRFISAANLRELFTATALMLVIGIALLMSLVGLSPALGTFLAGVVLANSAYRHELESDIDPFKGLLLGLFFMTVGAGIDFGLLGQNLCWSSWADHRPDRAEGGGHAVLAYSSGSGAPTSGYSRSASRRRANSASSCLSFTVANNVIPPDLADLLLLVVALSMLLTPALFITYDRVIAPRYADAEEREADDMPA